MPRWALGALLGLAGMLGLLIIAIIVSNIDLNDNEVRTVYYG